MTATTIAVPTTAPSTSQPSRWRRFLDAVVIGLAGSHPEAGALAAAFRQHDATREGNLR